MNYKGLTLVELLISTIIISIMLVGIMSTDYAVNKLSHDSTQDVSLSMRTSAMADRFYKAAREAIGDMTDPGASEGVLMNNTEDNGNYICFRYDADGDPSSFTNDQWRCFTRVLNATTGARTDFYTCDRTEAVVQAGVAGNIACTSGNQFVGTVVTDVFTAYSYPTFVNGMFHIQLVNRSDPSAGADLVHRRGTDDNPQVILPLDAFAAAQANN